MQTQPFDFMVPLWGKRYRDYFVDLSLPSLLAPRNLPLLKAEDGHRFLIATTAEDWQAIEHLPIVSRLRRHAAPVWVEIPQPENFTEARKQYEESTIKHQNYAQKKLVDAAYPRRAFGSMVFPDVIYSDGMVASLLDRIAEGVQLVLLPAMRQVEEDVLDDLVKQGYLHAGIRASATGEALTIPPRATAEMAVRHLHPEVAPYDQGNPVQNYSMPFRYWRVPGGQGIIFHTFFGCVALVDYSALDADHSICLEGGVFENVYAGQNFTKFSKIHVVQDSDEFSLLSLTPKAVNWAPGPDDNRPSPWWAPQLRRLQNIRQSMWGFAGETRNVMRRDLFGVTIRWHRSPIDRLWMKEERRVDRMIKRAVGDYFAVSRPPHRDRFPSRPNLLDRICEMELFQERLRARIDSRITAVLAKFGAWHSAVAKASRAMTRLPRRLRKAIRQAGSGRTARP